MIEEQVALNEIRQSTYKRKLETLKMLSSLSDKQLRKITEDDIIAYFKVTSIMRSQRSTSCISCSALFSKRQ